MEIISEHWSSISFLFIASSFSLFVFHERIRAATAGRMLYGFVLWHCCMSSFVLCFFVNRSVNSVWFAFWPLLRSLFSNRTMYSNSRFLFLSGHIQASLCRLNCSYLFPVCLTLQIFNYIHFWFLFLSTKSIVIVKTLVISTSFCKVISLQIKELSHEQNTWIWANNIISLSFELSMCKVS